MKLTGNEDIISVVRKGTKNARVQLADANTILLSIDQVNAIEGKLPQKVSAVPDLTPEAIAELEVKAPTSRKRERPAKIVVDAKDASKEDEETEEVTIAEVTNLDDIDTDAINI